jgi:shikimate kinase
MRGVGEANAAITIVNALPTGIGAAAGIALRARAEVRLEEARSGLRSEPKFRPESAGTPLVREAVRSAVGRLAGKGLVCEELEIRSEVPPSIGLKSSSAVASAVVLAVAGAVGRELSPREVAAASAEIGRAAGVSATGAYDDALAGLVGEAVVTDNRGDRLLESFPIDPSLAVALWIPPGTHASAPSSRSRFPGESTRTRAPADAARAGRLWEAMELNSDLVETAMGYSYGDVRRRLRGRGALASGTSGLGPALAAVAPRPVLPALLEELSGRPGTCRSVEFARPPATEAPS